MTSRAQTTEAFATRDRRSERSVLAGRCGGRRDQLIVEPLAVALEIVVLDGLGAARREVALTGPPMVGGGRGGRPGTSCGDEVMKPIHPDDRDGAPPASSPRLVVIAASAGALPAIIDVLAPLPPEFPAALALVMTGSDTGEGIGPELLPHVFEPFCQADLGSSRRQGGLGLGLSIVQQLVELRGGTIDVASPGRGHGATFTVRLPLAPAGSRA